MKKSRTRSTTILTTTISSTTTLSDLPDEIIWQIMLFLPLKDLKIFILSTKRFYTITKNDNFWKERFCFTYKYGYCKKLTQWPTWRKKYETLVILKEILIIGFKKRPCESLFVELQTSHVKNNKSFILDLINSFGHTHFCMFASNDLKNDKEFVLEVVKRHPYALECASDRLKDDKEFISKVLKQHPYLIKYASKRLRNDPNFVFYGSSFEKNNFEK